MRELKWNELKYFPDIKTYKNSESINLVGQNRAKEALNFGLEMKEKGYHIFITGEVGSGRTTYAKKYAENLAKNEPTPPDLCYVYNFENPRCPKLLTLEAGHGKIFLEEMNEFLSRLAEELAKTFGSKEHDKKKNELMRHFSIKRDIIMQHVSDEAREHQFDIKSTPQGVHFMPVIDGEPISDEQFDKLTNEQRNKIHADSERVQQYVSEAMRQIRDYEKRAKKDIEDFEYTTGLFTVGHHMNDLLQSYAEKPELLKYLLAVKEDILENLSDFLPEEHENEEQMTNMFPWLQKKTCEDFLSKYRINLMTDNSKTKGAPVVVDFNPSHANLVGEIEYDNEFGNFSTDFMKIKPGLFHAANGGYLILQAQDVFSNIHAWETIRKTLITGEIITEPLREFTTGVAMITIKPEPIPVNVKIILIGDSYYYHVLESYDMYFEKLFKVRADFDYEMRINNDNLTGIISFIKEWAKDYKLDNQAIKTLLEYSARLAMRQDRLTTRFSSLRDIISEARQNDKKIITGKDIKTAILRKEYRLNMYAEKLSDMFEDDSIMISTEGEKVGQINGLVVIDMSDYTFGAATRITSTVYMGKAGIVNIEKEADLSGSIHEKGIQVLIGYLGQTYAQDFPLSLSCRICFEQNYSGVDGDSASSTELYAVLSSLSGLPIRQDIAVTGSINQHGEIQPIGGATHKIEGFFNICNARGLTGSQGVIIPERNIRDLVLKDEVIHAVKKGMFHIYAVSHVDEGMEVIMNKKASEIHDIVYRKLRSYHRRAVKG